ncbi:MAG: hypothetical protein ACO2XQ_03630 [Flavobacteriales bacterium]
MPRLSSIFHLQWLAKAWILAVFLVSQFSITGQTIECEEVARSIRSFGLAKEDAKWASNELQPLLCQGFISSTQLNQMNRVLEGFKKYRMGSNNGVRDYVFTAHSILVNDSARWDGWHQVILQMLDDKGQRKSLPVFLENSAQLIFENVLWEDRYHTWEIDGKSWEFVVADDKPYVRFESVNLWMLNDQDTIEIKNIAGQWDVSDDELDLSGFRLPWKGTIFDEQSTYAEFPESQISLKKDYLSNASVVFHSEFIKTPIKGKIKAELTKSTSRETKETPVFESVQSSLKLDSLYEHFTFQGGIRIEGSNINGISSQGKPGKMQLVVEDSVFMQFEGAEFKFMPDGWESKRSGSAFYYKGDTVVHSDSDIRFFESNQTIDVLRQTEGIGQQPFYDGYHKLFWDVSGYSWTVGSPQIEIGKRIFNGPISAAFMSDQFFEKSEFERLRGYDYIHPIIELVDFGNQRGIKTFASSDYAQYLRLDLAQTQALLMGMANHGYVAYDLIHNRATIEDKAFAHVLYSGKRADYDLLRFISTPQSGANATWSLNNGFFTVRGVDEAMISPSREVSIVPSDKKVVIKEDCDFIFNGLVHAGNMELEGNQLDFDYSEFTLSFDKIEHVRFAITESDSTTSPPTENDQWLKSQLSQVSGRLSIDHPLNKSGTAIEQFPDFPTFKSQDPSFVYYDPEAFQGVYSSNSFYFAVVPFELNDLDNLSRENLKLDGTLVSSGIFQDIEEPLVVMEDYHFGFRVPSPNSGFPIYDSDAKFTSDVLLDGSGLHGDGTFEFNNARIESHDIFFLPDSVVARMDRFTHQSDINNNLPYVQGETGLLRFMREDESLRLMSKADPFQLYDAEANFSGEISLFANEMTANGEIEMKQARILSERFLLGHSKLRSVKADFSLFAETEAVSAFRTTDVTCAIDFSDREGLFAPNSGETAIELPIQQYLCYMDKFRWFMDRDEIILISERDVSSLPLDYSRQKKISNFVSIHPAQDSLHFLSSKAVYSIGQDVLNCDGVNEIALADATVLPGNQAIIIRQNAQMDPLVDAELIANSTTQHHYFKNVGLSVFGKNNFIGSGDYQYTQADKTVQSISMNQIYVDETLQTHAIGAVTAKDHFSLSEAFEFAGEMEVFASNPLLLFKGGARLVKGCDRFQSQWLAFESYIDPKNVAIPVPEQPLDVDGEVLALGMMASNRPPYDLYPSFLQPAGESDELMLMSPEGALQYKNGIYSIASQSKMENTKEPGNLIQLNPATCALTGNGSFNFPLNFGLAEFKMVGDFSMDNRGSAHFQGTIMLNYHFEQDLFDRMASQIPNWTASSSLNLGETNFETALSTWLGRESSQDLINDLALTGQLKNIPKQMRNAMILTGVDLTWDDREEAWISSSQLGIATLGKASAFIQMPGKLELRRNRSGDEFSLYLHGNEENWYFQDYKLVDGLHGKLNLTASDKVFYEILNDIRVEKRTDKGKEGQTITYQPITSTRKRDNLVDTYRDFD